MYGVVFVKPSAIAERDARISRFEKEKLTICSIEILSKVTWNEQ